MHVGSAHVAEELLAFLVEPDERLVEAVRFLADAVTRADRVKTYLDSHPRYRIA